MKITHQQQKLWMPGPPSVNDLFVEARNKYGRAKTHDYQSWIRRAQQELLLQKPKRHEGKVVLAFFHGMRSVLADCSNYVKAAEDLLVTMGIIEGDNAKTVQGVSSIWVPGYNGSVVHITPFSMIGVRLWAGFDDGVMGQVN